MHDATSTNLFHKYMQTHIQACVCVFFFNDTATTEIYTLSLHDALPILTLESAAELLENEIVLATMMLAEGHVDGLVAGATHTTAETLRPALQLIRTAKDARQIGRAHV